MNPQAKVHIADILHTQLRVHNKFEPAMKMLEWIVTGIILIVAHHKDSEFKGTNPIALLDHMRDNVATLLKHAELPQDAVDAAVANLKREKKNG